MVFGVDFHGWRSPNVCFLYSRYEKAGIGAFLMMKRASPSEAQRTVSFEIFMFYFSLVLTPFWHLA